MTTLTARSSASNINISILPEWSALMIVKLTQEVSVNHCYLDSLKKKKTNQKTNPLLFALGTTKKQETLSNRDVERQVEDRPPKTVQIIQMRTPEVKTRQFIVNRVTLALRPCWLCHMLSLHINSWKRRFKKSRVMTPECVSQTSSTLRKEQCPGSLLLLMDYNLDLFSWRCKSARVSQQWLEVVCGQQTRLERTHQQPRFPGDYLGWLPELFTWLSHKNDTQMSPPTFVKSQVTQ